MKHITRLLSDRHGTSNLVVLTIILAIAMLFAAVYNIATVYVKADGAKKDLQRAATIAVDTSLLNENIRDLVTDVQVDAETILRQNLGAAGFVKKGSSWVCYNASGKAIYSFNDLSVSIDGKIATVTGTVTASYPWDVNGSFSATLPIRAQSRVIFINTAPEEEPPAEGGDG